MKGFPAADKLLGAFLFVVASIVILNAISKRVPALGAAIESV